MVSEVFDTGARIFHSSIVPVLVPAAIRRARCPGMSFGLATSSEADNGVKVGEDAADRPEKPKGESSAMV